MDEQECARFCTPENLTKKRSRSSPTLQTPHRESKRIPLRQWNQNCAENSEVGLSPPRPRVLSETFSKKSNPKEKWTDDELAALTEFVLFHTEGTTWPSHKQEGFWSAASEFVQTRSGHCRSGKCYCLIACIIQVLY